MSNVLILSDIHGNFDALKTILETEKNYSEIIVLGDLVDYGPQPAEVIDVLKESDARIIRGNHDHAVAFNIDCRCGEKTHWISVWFRENITRQLLGNEEKKYLGKLPISYDYNNFLFVHGSPRNHLYDYLYPWEGKDTICSKITNNKGRLSYKNPNGSSDDLCETSHKIIFVGHTHIQFSIKINGTLIVNPGSVGQPRDGDNRASYIVLDDENETLILKRVKYPVYNTIKKLEEVGVSGRYLIALKKILLKARV